MNQRLSGRIRRHELSKSAVVISLAISPKYLAVGLDDSLLHIFTAAADPLHTLPLSGAIANSLMINDDSLVIGCTSGILESWDLLKGEKMISFSAHEDTISAIVASGPTTVVTSSRDCTLKVWNTEDWKCKYTLSGHKDVVRQIAVQDNILVSASYDSTCKIWDISSGDHLKTLAGHTNKVYAIAFDGTTVVSGSLDCDVRVWNASDGSCRAVLRGHNSLVSHVHINSGLLVTASTDGQIRAWSLETLDLVYAISQAHPHAVNSMQIKDGLIISGGSDDIVKVWQLNNGALIKEKGAYSKAVWKVGFTEDGRDSIIHAFWDDAAVLEILDFQ